MNPPGFFGATGEFPEDKLCPDDEGELRLGVASKDGHVYLNFGKPVIWLAMPPDQARGLAALLEKHAAQIEENST